MTRAADVPWGKLFYSGGWLFLRLSANDYECLATDWTPAGRRRYPLGQCYCLREEMGQLIDMSTPYDGGPA